MTLTHARIFLERRNIHLSLATISSMLNEAGYSQRVPLSKPLLSSGHIKKRFEWCSQVTEVD